MSTKHYPYVGGNFDRIIFDGDGSVWVPESENAKARELAKKIEHYEQAGCHECPYADGCEAHTLYDEECPMSREIERMKRELGVEVD